MLFPCSRRLEQYAGQCENNPEKIAKKCRKFNELMDNGLISVRSADAVNWILKNGGIFRTRWLKSGREGLIWGVIL